MMLMDDMARPCNNAGRDTSACRLVGRSLIPMAQYQAIAADLSRRAAEPHALAARRIHFRNIAELSTDSAQTAKLANSAIRAEPADKTAKYTAPMAATPAPLA